MTYSDLNKNIIAELEKTFSDYQFSIQIEQYLGNIPIFFITETDSSYIKNDWEKITSFIAVNYQSKLKDEYNIWNIYLFFILKEPIEKILKYQIENDTFSSRKIVIEIETDTAKIIEQYVTNSNLQLLQNQDISEVVFEPNANITSVLSGKIVISKNKKTAVAQVALDELYEKMGCNK